MTITLSVLVHENASITRRLKQQRRLYAWEKNSLTLVVRASLTGILLSAFSEFTQSTLRGNWGPIVNWITIHFVAFLFWRKKSRHMTNAISMRHTHGIPLTIFINASLYVFYSSLRNGTWLHMVNRAMCLLPL